MKGTPTSLYVDCIYNISMNATDGFQVVSDWFIINLTESAPQLNEEIL